MERVINKVAYKWVLFSTIILPIFFVLICLAGLTWEFIVGAHYHDLNPNN